MPFSFRDKERPSDKFHDKSDDDFMNGIRKQFDQERKMFFEKQPAWESAPSAAGFSRSHFFDDDPMMAGRSSGGRQDLRAHLDDLAHRHPEFADSLRGPPWSGDARGAAWGGRPRRGSGSAGEDDAASSSAASNMSDPHQDPEQADEPGPLRGRPRTAQPSAAQYSGLPAQYAGLRNTVPDMGQRQMQEEAAEEREGRGQRSWSAPPDNRAPPPAPPQRFVSRLNIDPVAAQEAAADANAAAQQPLENQSKPPPAPKQPHAPQPPPKPVGNVRHIPIFVEGRDEPVVPKNLDSEPAAPDPQQPPHFTSQTQHHFHPQPPPPQGRPFANQKRPFQTPQGNPPQQKQQNRSFNSSPKPFQQPNMQQQQQQPQQQQQNVNNFPPSQSEESARPEPPKVANDPISRVQAIQNEVATYRAEVDKYSGNSRKDKEYIFIDEMLTRNLLKLDDIETEGREDIRQARKTAIRSIQECINNLEAKAPLPADQAPQPMEVAEGGEAATGMETGEAASVDSATEEANKS